MPARKRTTFMTNCPAMAMTLNKKCRGEHQHEHLESRRKTRAAQEYPGALCEAIVEGVRLQQEWDASGKFLMACIAATDKAAKEQGEMEARVPPEEEDYEEMMQATDDLSGKELDPVRVRAARKLEMEYYDKHKVYIKVPIEECYKATGKAPIKARWIDVDKGEEYRSRWVAKQFKNSDAEEWFAATPPLEMMRAIISDAVTGDGEKAIMVNDVSRAFFYAPVQHEIYVELCEEAIKTEEDRGKCAKLLMSMYGTKAAGQNWQRQVQETMRSFGFKQGRASPVVFWHPTRRIKTLVHGDDFFSSGSPKDLMWMKQKLEERYEIKSKIIGEDPALGKELRMLHRKIVWHPGVGVSYEADEKHARTIIEETGAQKMKPVLTPITS